MKEKIVHYKEYFIETCKYYITNWWINSFFYLDVAVPAKEFRRMVKSSVTKEEAVYLSKKRCYRWLSKSYKKRIIDEKFN